MEGKIYMGVARDLEDSILAGELREGDMVPSTHQVAKRYSINPATAARGVSQLTARGILVKQRGIGLFVAEGARDRLMDERRESFRTGIVKAMLDEAHVLGISKRDLLAIVMSS
jgi:DNA-binding transcriptional regulator YhcF (GntR family)